MRKILLIAISGVSFCTMPAQAQFNTIAKTPERYKVEALQEGMKKPEPTPESMAPVQETSTKPADESKKLWIDRYLSVSYLQRKIDESLKDAERSLTPSETTAAEYEPTTKAA